MRIVAQFFGILFSFALDQSLGSSALAQTSFSSIWYKTSPTGYDWSPSTNYAGARLYSEDNRRYLVRSFGCEFDVQEGFTQSEYDRIALQFFLGVQDQSRSDSRLSADFGARLVRGRPIAEGGGRPAGFTCDTASQVVAAVFARIDGTPVLYVLQMQSQGGRVFHHHRYIFAMRPDYFTPAQERRAWQMAGSLGLAILRAWLSRGGN